MQPKISNLKFQKAVKLKDGSITYTLTAEGRTKADQLACIEIEDAEAVEIIIPESLGEVPKAAERDPLVEILDNYREKSMMAMMEALNDAYQQGKEDQKAQFIYKTAEVALDGICHDI